MLQRDPDCEPLYGSGYVCEDQICVEAPDPCDPSPCGPGAISTPNGQTCQCTCPSGFLGDPNVECIQVFKQIYQGYLPLILRVFGYATTKIILNELYSRESVR